jgi:hypothetical protein
MVVGHPAFYPRFGFVPAHPLGLSSEPAMPAEAFHGGGSSRREPCAVRRGVIVYGSDFG